MHKSETAKVLSTLRAVWSNEEITPEKIEVYHWVIGDYTFDQMMTAARVHIGRGKFFPKPAELLEIVAETLVPAVSAGQAWELVLKQIGKHGRDGFGSVAFDDEAVLDAVKAIGWQRLCNDDNSKGYVRRDFDSAYENAVIRRRKAIQDGGEMALPATIGGHLVELPRRAS